MNARLPVLAACALVAVSAVAQQPTPEEQQKALFSHTPAAFRELKPAQQQIDRENIDFDLLSAAIFHETNARRAKHELPILKHHAQVREAAAMQARILKERDVLAHVNPERADKETPSARLKAVGLNPQLGAENVATGFLLNYKSGDPVFIDEKGGKKIFRREPGGPPLQPHTYISFAETLVEQWMNSPEHRKNILLEGPEYLGTACRLDQDVQMMDIFLCAQVFFTPF